MTGLRKKAFSAVKWTTVSSIATSGLAMLQLSIMGRLLSPADFGLMAMAMVITGFAQTYADMGISSAIIQRQDSTKDQLSSLYWLTVLSGLAIFILVVSAAPLAGRLYGESRVTGIIRFGSLIFIITPFGQQFQILMQKKLMFNMLARIEILSSVTGVAVATASAFTGQGVYSLIWGQLANTSSKSLLLARHGMKQWRPCFHFRKSDLKGYLGFGIYQMGERSVNYLNWNMDKLIIGSLLGAQPLGYYNIAYQLMIKPFSIFNPIITKVVFPLFSKVQEDDRRLRDGYLDTLRAVSLVLFPVYVAMIMFAEPIIRLFLGPNWLPAAPVLRVLAVLGMFYSVGNPIGSLLLAKGRVKIGFYFNILAIFLYATAMYFGSAFGVVGIAISILLATMVVLYPIDLYIQKLLVGMSLKEYASAIMPILISSLLMGAIIYFLGNDQLTYSNSFELILFLGIGAVSYLIIIFFWQGKTFSALWKEFH